MEKLVGKADTIPQEDPEPVLSLTFTPAAILTLIR
jgi:hypothetical protein